MAERNYFRLAMALCAGLTGCVWIARAQTTPEQVPSGRTQLYTQPDPSATGGIRGRIGQPSRPIEQILAIPADFPAHVYEGNIDGHDRRSFSFSGLPMNRYDLIVIHQSTIFEGLRLHRGADTLSTADREGIRASIDRSEPFFNVKSIHRIEGDSGRGNTARAFCTYWRDKPADAYLEVEARGYRRTHKLVLLKDVGPGWQIVRTRDLYPVWTDPEHALLRHAYHASLVGIRVTDSVRDLGVLSLE